MTPSRTPPKVAPRAATPRSPGQGRKAGRDIGYCHLGKLHNPEALPRDGFTVKIRGASAGWTCAAAIVDD